MVLFEFISLGLLYLMADWIQIGIIGSLVYSQLIVLIPAVLFLVCSREKMTHLITVTRPKVSTSLLVIVLTYLCMPLIVTVNAISMLFVDNEVTALSGLLSEVPAWQVLLMVGILGPICEEFVFRGVLYHGFRKSGRIISAMLWSAFLFGLMHMNFNQMSYAIVVGVIGTFLVEGCGSIFYSILMHVCINMTNALQMVFMDVNAQMDGMASEQFVEQTMQMPYKQALCIMISIMAVIVTVTTTLAVCLFWAIIRKENRTEHMRMILHLQSGQEQKSRLVSVPLVLGIVLCLGYMILDVCLIE